MLDKLLKHAQQISLSALPLLTPMLLSCSQAGQVVGKADPELPLPPQFQLHFNHRDAGRYRQPLNGQWRNGDNLEDHLVQQINAASEELLVAIQELTLPEISQALIRAKKRGVNVQVVLENNYSKPWSEQHPSDLTPHGRRRLEQLQLLADSNRDGRLSADERLSGDSLTQDCCAFHS